MDTKFVRIIATLVLFALVMTVSFGALAAPVSGAI